MAALATLSPVGIIREAAVPLTGTVGNFDPLLEWIGDSSVVLLGEASHGTHEFYKARAEITKRLIAERGFTAVAVEADWPDAYHVNRFVRGEIPEAEGESEAVDALSQFRRFPTWMWRNADVLDFVGWLRNYNEHRVAPARTGFYGLDLYSLLSSIEAVLHYLDRVDPEAARRARQRYGCFEHFNTSEEYGMKAGFGLSRSCEDQAVNELIELRRHASEVLHRTDRPEDDDYFFAVQNARVIRNAEQYYRTMFRGGISSWNLRDRHMADTLDVLIEHLRQRQKPKIVVWAHNSHLGDARATELSEQGELNVGQMVRERHAVDAFLIGFTTYSGTVTAASGWDRPAERKLVRPALPGSVEALFHAAGLPRFMLNLRADDECADLLNESRLERAIGVVYLPETERESHYFEVRLAEQFDAVIHFDESRAVEPLERTSQWHTGEAAETFPSGM